MFLDDPYTGRLYGPADLISGSGGVRHNVRTPASDQAGCVARKPRQAQRSLGSRQSSEPQPLAMQPKTYTSRKAHHFVLVWATVADLDFLPILVVSSS